MKIRDQYIKLIESAVLRPNDPLPSVRSLAVELGINPNTVQRAFEQLEALGYVVAIPKKGFFVSNTPQDKPIDLSAFLFEVRQLKNRHVDKTELIRIINEEYFND